MLLAALGGGCLEHGGSPAARENQSYRLVYGLAADSLLTLSSPDLNLQINQLRSADEEPDSTEAGQEPPQPLEMPRDLRIEYTHPARGDASRLTLQFAEQGNFLDRALLETGILARTWSLEINAELARSSRRGRSEEFDLGFASDLTGLWWLDEGRPERESAEPGKITLRIPEKLSVQNFSQASGVDADDLVVALAQEGIRASGQTRIDARTWQSVGEFFGITVEPRQQHYRAFRDIRLGYGLNRVTNLNLSLGGLLPALGGELVGTYRLLQRSGEETYPVDEGFYENALALQYSGHYEGFVKSFGNTLTWYSFARISDDSDSMGGEAEYLSGKIRDYDKWKDSFALSLGEDAGEPLLSFIDGYRFDFSLSAERVVFDPGSTLESNDLGILGWEGLLKLKTPLGTFLGGYDQASYWKKMAFSLAKKGRHNSKMQLYYENIEYSGRSASETRFGGRLEVVLDGRWPEWLSLAYWRLPESGLFSHAPLRGYTSPRQGRPVVTLGNDRPGVIQ